MSRSTRKQQSKFEREGHGQPGSTGSMAVSCAKAGASTRSRSPPSMKSGEEAEVACWLLDETRRAGSGCGRQAGRALARAHA